MKATDATAMLMFLSTNPCASAMTFVTYLRFSGSINSAWFFNSDVRSMVNEIWFSRIECYLEPISDGVLSNADINGQRQKLLISGFTMSQIKIILDEEMELMKNKCKNSVIDFLFVLDGSGNRNDDSKAGGFKILPLKWRFQWPIVLLCSFNL